ncbi:hypothetical protein O6H91_08G048000 [Diphasiastrum complanatum]|uniref:Uncharacterized protein n=1 Tax=Diphasiastrum complanatum TaxID=34168 RepID=A0ACC2CXC8_DIPCM|nr:hypothetical protein O6H91_08G048000 [Diphasiastrum complanatum]
MRRLRCLGFVLLLSLLLPHRFLVSAHNAVEDDEEDWDSEDPSDTPSFSAAEASANVVGKAQKVLLELTDQSVERVIASQEYLLLLGYAPWCTRSSDLMPEYAAAASELSAGGSNVLLAKIDAISNPRAASLYNIKGFPHLLFFTNGTVQMYNGGLSGGEIVNWVQKKTGLPAITISSSEDASNILNQNVTFVAGFFQSFEGSDYEQFIEVAKNEVGTVFVQTINSDVAKVLNPKPQIVPPLIWILKDEPEHVVNYEGNFNYDEIFDFVEINKHPLVIGLTSDNMAKVYSSPVKLQVLLFCEAEDYEMLLPLYEKAAKEFKGKVLFLLMDTADEELSRPMLAIYGLEPGTPTVAGFDYANGLKYLLEAEITGDNLRLFCSDLVNQKLPQHYKSKPIPAANEGDVKVVVGKTFDEIVLKESKDVFLEVTMPWCLLCEKADKVFRKLGKVFKEVPSLVIATIDASANEHPLLKVDNFPEMLFYPAGRKDAPPVVAPAKLNLKELVKFVRANAVNPISLSTGGVQKKEEVAQEVKVAESSESFRSSKEEL